MAKHNTESKKNNIVLVGVLKNQRDLDLLLNENWYRIPMTHVPTRRFGYLAFYQPAIFGQRGKCIQYYARILRSRVAKRIELLPNELINPRAGDYYLRISVGKVKKLSLPIRNIIPRRVSFGFTTLSRLLNSKNILQLYNIVPTEQIIEEGLRRVGIRTVAQYYVLNIKKRYRLDLAVFCKQGTIAIECDNEKAHSGLCQREKDKAKDAFLKKSGWSVIRLSEYDIVSHLGNCITRIKKTVQKFGGLACAVD